ncbi:MAG: hypothetical protein WKG07_09135 [Hymenobacter sp.]
MSDDMAACDLLLGVKEVPVAWLRPGQTYCFFSHTIKQQPGNQQLLQTILKEQITLIDYELLTNAAGQRVVAFGHWAGIVGAYNGLLTYGRKHGLFALKPACAVRGYGRYGGGIFQGEAPTPHQNRHHWYRPRGAGRGGGAGPHGHPPGERVRLPLS